MKFTKLFLLLCLMATLTLAMPTPSFFGDIFGGLFNKNKNNKKETPTPTPAPTPEPTPEPQIAKYDDKIFPDNLFEKTSKAVDDIIRRNLCKDDKNTKKCKKLTEDISVEIVKNFKIFSNSVVAKLNIKEACDYATNDFKDLSRFVIDIVTTDVGQDGIISHEETNKLAKDVVDNIIALLKNTVCSKYY